MENEVFTAPHPPPEEAFPVGEGDLRRELLVLGCRKIYGIVTKGNPLVGPHQSTDWFAMTGRF